MRIFTHHSAGDRDDTFGDVHKTHLERGFRDTGYTIMIRMPRDQFVPEIGYGRPYDKDDDWEPWEYGAQVKGHNHESIGVCVIGNFEEEALPRQMEQALAFVCYLLCRQFDEDEEAVQGHNEVAATSCPGKFINMDDVRYSVGALLWEAA